MATEEGGKAKGKRSRSFVAQAKRFTRLLRGKDKPQSPRASVQKLPSQVSRVVERMAVVCVS